MNFEDLSKPIIFGPISLLLLLILYHFHIWILALFIGVSIAAFEESNDFQRLKSKIKKFGVQMISRKDCMREILYDEMFEEEKEDEVSDEEEYDQKYDVYQRKSFLRSIIRNYDSLTPTRNPNWKELDSILTNLSRLITRDFIENWYKNFSPNDKILLKDINVLIIFAINALLTRIEKVNWELFFCTKPLEILLVHFKKVKSIRTGQIRNDKEIRERLGFSDQDQPENNNNLENLSTHFDKINDVNQYLENNTSSLNNITQTNPKSYQDYLTIILSVILTKILPKQVYNTKILHLLIRNIISYNLLYPAFKYLASPDYINQQICKNLAAEGELEGQFCYFVNDVFTEVLKNFSTIEELVSLKKLVEERIENLNSCDGLEDSLKHDTEDLENPENIDQSNNQNTKAPIKAEIKAMDTTLELITKKIHEFEMITVRKHKTVDTDNQEKKKIAGLVNFLESQNRLLDRNLVYFDLEMGIFGEKLKQRKKVIDKIGAEKRREDFQGLQFLGNKNQNNARIANEQEKLVKNMASYVENQRNLILDKFLMPESPLTVCSFFTTQKYQIQGLSDTEMLRLNKPVKSKISDLWKEYQKAIKIIGAEIISVDNDETYITKVICSIIEDSWTAEIKYSQFESFQKDLGKFSSGEIKISRKFPTKFNIFPVSVAGAFSNPFANKEKRKTEMNRFLDRRKVINHLTS